MTYLEYMKLALEEASFAYQSGEVPVGAVIVDCNGKIIGKGHNQVEELQDPTAHAELIALRNASHKIHNWRLEGATLFCTMEPCVMCAGSLIQARIKRVVYATKDSKFGAAGSLYNILEDKRFNHNTEVEAGLLKEESIKLLKDFFSSIRKKGKSIKDKTTLSTWRGARVVESGGLENRCPR